jgi:hypothetical protein
MLRTFKEVFKNTRKNILSYAYGNETIHIIIKSYENSTLYQFQ